MTCISLTLRRPTVKLHDLAWTCTSLYCLTWVKNCGLYYVCHRNTAFSRPIRGSQGVNPCFNTVRSLSSRVKILSGIALEFALFTTYFTQQSNVCNYLANHREYMCSFTKSDSGTSSWCGSHNGLHNIYARWVHSGNL